MSRRRTPGTLNDGVISSASSFDEEGESSRPGSRGYTSSHVDGDEPPWDAFDELDPSDSASASAEYKAPPRTHSARRRRSTERRHKIPNPRNSYTFRAPPAPMSVDPSDDYGPAAYGRGFAPPLAQNPGSFYGSRAPQPSYPQSHVGGFMPPNHHYASQVVPYNNYQQNPFAPMGAPNGANYFGEHRPPYDMIPYQGAGYFGGPGGPGGPGGYGVPTHLQQYMYSNPPAPPATEAPGPPTTPAPPAEKKMDPEMEAMRAQLELFRAEQARKEAAAQQKEQEERIKRDAEEALQRRIEDMRRAQEEAKKDIERARAEAEMAAREKIEAERKAEEERRRLHEETMKQAEREARLKLEAEMKALEERRKREVQEEEERRRHHAETLRRAEFEAREKLEAEMRALDERKRLEAEAAAAAEAAAKAKIEAAMKAEAEAKEAAERKAAEEAEWRKKLEEDAKLKAEIEARAKLEAEKQAAEDAKKAEEQKKKDDEALKKKILEEAKVKVEEAAKKKEKSPIKFKDAVGRKFSFPFHICQTWPGMEELIKQAFLHVEGIGPHVQEGRYDLIGPNGEIILPSIWEKVIEPDWSITMHMWSMDKNPPPRGHVPGRPPGAAFPPGDPRNDPRHFHHRPGGAMPPMPPGMRPGAMRPPGMGAPVPGPPPPGWAGRGMGGGPGPRGGPPAAVVVDAEPPRTKKSSKSGGAVLGWMAGSKPTKSTKKKR